MTNQILDQYRIKFICWYSLSEFIHILYKISILHLENSHGLSRKIDSSSQQVKSEIDYVRQTRYLCRLFAASQNSLCVTSKVTEVTIERIDGSLGITLRGGLVPDHPHLSRPLIITQVRQNGPAHRYVPRLFYTFSHRTQSGIRGREGGNPHSVPPTLTTVGVPERVNVIKLSIS